MGGRDDTADTTRSAPKAVSTRAFIKVTLLLLFVAGSSRKNGIWLTEFVKDLILDSVKQRGNGTVSETVL